ncbi:dehydrodolichyl diphosphate synthase 2-like, partial [Silene latifolia]|uniref:dehydrodolichyl diphosphate synthase 2-like n=1 Tax=Silene latifolia TaxID=37657 RepID=UPI003D786B6F
EANELLFRQLQTYLDDNLDNIKRKGIKLWMIGEKSALPEYLQATIKNVEEVTKNNTKLELMFALCYGGTREIAQATRSLCEKVKEGAIDPEEIDEELMEKELWTGPSRAPNPDLLIRTGGRIRVSNYLIWQLNQTELYFCKTYAPDFKEADFIEALRSYQQRVRTFGE